MSCCTLGFATNIIARQRPLLLKHSTMLLSCTSHALRTSIDSITSGEEMSPMQGVEGTTRRFTAEDGVLPDYSPLPCPSHRCIPWRKNIPYSSTLVNAWPHLVQQYCKLAKSTVSSPQRSLTKKYHFLGTGAHIHDEGIDPDDAQRQAAVLVPICSVQGVPSLLFTVRAAHMKHHASEVCFPGGHVEDDIDCSLVDTALREANEELLPPPGLLRNNVQIIGHLTTLPSKPLGGTPVTPIIGVIWPNLPNPVSSWFPGNPAEVEVVFSVPIQELYENDISSNDNNDLQRQGYLASMSNNNKAPTFPTPFGEIWGLTANIIQPLLHQVLKPAFLDHGASHENHNDTTNNNNNNKTIIQHGHYNHDEATQQGQGQRDVCCSN